MEHTKKHGVCRSPNNPRNALPKGVKKRRLRSHLGVSISVVGALPTKWHGEGFDPHHPFLRPPTVPPNYLSTSKLDCRVHDIKKRSIWFILMVR